MKVGIVGAGINGICIGWEFSRAGHAVTMMERDCAVVHTSQSSSKLLHGGLRYLENGEFRLVREALQERRAWLDAAPSLARPLQINLPVYRSGRRGKHLLGFGLTLYDWLAWGSGLPGHKWLTREAVVALDKSLKHEELLGAYQFWDGQMDDRQLGLWAARQACQTGAILMEGVDVARLNVDGRVEFRDGKSLEFDLLINAAGPWAQSLLEASGLPSRHGLDLVRGSHLVLERPAHAAYLLEVPGERRIFFALPWQGGTLVGTTEVRQAQPTVALPSDDEIAYLLDAYNAYFAPAAGMAEIRETFAGLRPLVKSATNPSRATREYALERNRRLITVFGGKWTTARSLARKVHRLAQTQ